MAVVVVVAPVESPIDLEMARRHLRVDDDCVNDDDIQLLIDAAVAQLDGPAGWLGRAIMSQTLELRLDGFCEEIALPYPPFAEVTSIKYDDANNTEQTVDPSIYRVVGGDRPRLILARSKSWPGANGECECVRIRYGCGYGDGVDDVPASIRNAVLVMIKAAYSLGERNLFISAETVDGVGSAQYVVTDNALDVMRTAAESMLQSLRVYS